MYGGSPPSGVPNSAWLRDFQAGVQLDRNLPAPKWAGWIGETTLSSAYYFQDQTSPAVLNVTAATPLDGATFTGLPGSTKVFSSTGPIHVAQVRYGFGTGKGKVPNRADLLEPQRPHRAPGIGPAVRREL